MAGRVQDEDPSFCKCVCCCIAVAAAIATYVTVSVLISTSKDAVYTVTVTGVAGLDLDPAASLALSPVFDLTFRIDSARNRLYKACVGRLSAVAVSYGDALLGRGSAPQFCAREGEVRERRARAWAQGVALPPFLRDQLAAELAAGDAAVDVRVTTPATDFRGGDTVLVCDGARIGGGPAPCRLETVYNRPQADPLAIIGV